jgi:uncharacterized tellurite resistance protein B-like protein
MLDLIRKALGGGQGRDVSAGPAEDARIQLAACVILLEAAHADYESTDEELDHVLATIRHTFRLSHEYAEELMVLARAEREQAVDLWEFTNAVNGNFSREEKIKVVEAVWRIIFADGEIDKHEDYFVRKLTNLLRLTHREMIGAKLRVKDTENS